MEFIRKFTLLVENDVYSFSMPKPLYQDSNSRTLLNFLQSPYFYLLLVHALVLNRCSAIVAPRTNRTPSLLFRVLSRVPLIAAFSYFASRFILVLSHTPQDYTHPTQARPSATSTDSWKVSDNLFFDL